MSDVALILGRLKQGDAKAAEELLPLVYEELRKLAALKMAAQPPGQTLQATALVHEAYLPMRAFATDEILSLCWTGPKPGNPEAVTMSLCKGVKRDPNLGFLLHVQNGAPSTAGSIVLQASSNLADWTPLATNSPAATWPFVDTSIGSQQRYYRTRRP